MEAVRCTLDAADVRKFYEELSLDIVAFQIDHRLLANFDETMLKAIDRVLKVYFIRELPRPTIPMDDKVTHITLAPTIFANGDSLLPIAILNVMHVPTDFSDDVVRGFHWAYQSSGWMNMEIFEWYIKSIFIPSIESRRRQFELYDRWALLLVDGHCSRANPELMQLCLDSGIHVRSYVSHSSHMCQVLDRGVFRAFKTSITSMKSRKSYKKPVEWRREMMGHAVTAMRVATSPGTICRAWEESGCWPVDEKRVLNSANFPDLGFEAHTSSLPPKRTRKGFKISNRRLTSEQAIKEMKKQYGDSQLDELSEEEEED